MESLELRWFLDRRFFQYQHMDDRGFISRGRAFLVAGLDLCVGWLYHSRILRRPHLQNRRSLSHWFSNRQQVILRYLGFSLAGL